MPRPPLFARPMTPSERQRRHRAVVETRAATETAALRDRIRDLEKRVRDREAQIAAAPAAELVALHARIAEQDQRIADLEQAVADKDRALRAARSRSRPVTARPLRSSKAVSRPKPNAR
jgi:uncharacterized coiled-coil protein SlyX